MNTILKLSYKNILYHKKRTIFTLFCVVFSVSLISIALCLFDSIIGNVDFKGSVENYSATRNLCIAFCVMAIFMSCFTICTVFSISSQDRIKEYGFLTSIGMSSSQNALIIICETFIYGIIGVILGTALGYTIASVFYKVISSLVFNSAGIDLGYVVIAFPSVFRSFFFGLFSVILSSCLPIIKMRRITILDTIKTNNAINISLKESLLSKITGRFFGRIGDLAGQNYENNKGRYRAISLALSGGTIFFLTVHSFFLFPFWYELDQHNSFDKVEKIWYPLALISALFMIYFVLVFIFCSMGSVHQNVEQRRSEFAIYKSMGMQNTELQKMVSIECLFFTWYSIWFGLLGSLLGTYLVCNFYRLTGISDLKFHYAIFEFAIFVSIDIIVGFIFSLYFRMKIRKINIIDTIRNG